MPTDAPAHVSIVIAGGAPVTSTNVYDLLADWLRLDTEDPVEVHIYLPGDERYISKVVKFAAEFAEAAEIGFELVQGSKIGPKVKELKRAARAEIDSDTEDDMTGDLIAVLEGDAEVYLSSPYLIVAYGPDDSAPDDFTAELVQAALEADIPVLEIAARGLDELIPDQDIEEGQQAAETVEAAVQRHPAGELEKEIEAAAEEEPEEEETLEQVLSWVFAHLTHTDHANAAASMASPRERPLTLAVQRQLHKLNEAEWQEMAELKQQPVTEADDKPARGRSRAGKGEIAVLVNEAGEIVGKAGRGRPAEGLTRKIVSEDEFHAAMTPPAT